MGEGWDYPVRVITFSFGNGEEDAEGTSVYPIFYFSLFLFLLLFLQL